LIVRLNAINVEMMKSEDKQISLSDPDTRSMATSGKDTGIVGYNVQIAVDTQHHLIVAHEVTNVGSDRHQLASMADQARAEMFVETLNVVADRGYYDSQEILACEEAGIAVTLPKPLTSGAKAAWMDATHFLIRRRHKVATEMALNVLAYNMKRVIAILGCRPLLQAIQT